MAKAKSDLDQWKDAARAVSNNELPSSNVPLHVLFGEAVDVARFFAKYWKPQKEAGAPAVPGLESAASKNGNGVPKMTAKTGEEILSLQRAAQEAQTRYLLVVDPGNTAELTERARFLLDEMTATLEWLFDDGVEDEKDAQLARLGAAHADDPQSADALASALDDYATLCKPHEAEMDGLGGFEVAYIAEANALAAELRGRPAQATPMSEQARAAITLRNRMVTLLWERMSTVRGAARFVFRKQPDLVREATSAYERRRRAASRRAQGKKDTGAPATAPGGAVAGSPA
ncbi:MAG: hypothetical protein ABI193_10715 [Minicystis sp.]